MSMRRSGPLAAIILLLWGLPAFATPHIAIIIDDLGDRLAEGERAIALPGPVAMAFLPHAVHVGRLATAAHEDGKEVLLHLPLQAVGGNDLGPGAITLDTGEAAFRRILRGNLASVPHVSGLNTHMGSLLTRHPGHMGWLMSEILAIGGLFFVDSWTTSDSVALALAEEAGVPAIRRHVFLDSEADVEAIRFQFQRLIRWAHAEGRAVGIGHPYTETLQVLEEELPRLEEHGVVLVPVSALLSSPERVVQDR